MGLEHQMKNGLLYCEFGHSAQSDRDYEKKTALQRQNCKEQMYDYNHTRPSDYAEKERILRGLLAEVGKGVFIESPLNMAYGCNTHIGNWFYANFNLVVVDDCDVYIGDHVLLGPNVTLSATGHPVWGEYRRSGAQFSLPIRIGNDVWIGANACVMPGVTIGDDVVIGAGSVVTHDIPPHTVAYGVPCRVVRPITEQDRDFYRKDCPVNDDWNK